MATRRWTPAAIPVGIALMLLGAWAFVAPLVGPTFHYGFFTSHAWAFGNGLNWKLPMAGGIAIAVGGLLMTTPSRGLAPLGGLLAFAGGAWLLVGPTLHPLWASGTIHPIPHSTAMTALLWIGYFYGTGGLALYLSGVAHGLLSRRTVVEDMPVYETPVDRTVPVERTERTVTRA